MTSHSRHLDFSSSTSQLTNTTPGQHESIEILTLAHVRHERRADAVTMTSFPVQANIRAKRPPTIETSPVVSTDTKAITYLLESPKTRSVCVTMTSLLVIDHHLDFWSATFN
jgi:hypothetical protein